MTGNTIAVAPNVSNLSANTGSGNASDLFVDFVPETYYVRAFSQNGDN